MSELLKDLKMERVQGSSAVLNYSNFDYWVNWDDIVEIVEKHKQPILNENQQVVLEWLKEDGDPNITVMLWQLTDNVLESQSMSVDIGEHVTAWKSLTDKQQFEVLAAYAEWGMKNDK